MNRFKPILKHWRHALLIGLALLFAMPLLVMVLSSLKTPEELARNPYVLLPETWRWQNYPDALSAIPYWRYLFNSLLLCTGCVIGATLSCSLVAWSLSQINWQGRRVAFVVVIGTMLLPWQVTMVPRFVLITEAGLYDSLWAIILPTFLGEAFFIFLLRQFFMSIPRELAGGRAGRRAWRVGIVLENWLAAQPAAIATVAVFQFVYTWNDFSGPLLYLNDPEKFPLAYGLERFVSSYGDQTHLLLAASVMFTVPMIILFFLAQRTFIQGIATTGLKG